MDADATKVSDQPSAQRSSSAPLWLALAGIVVLWFSYGVVRLHVFRLGLGSIHEPTNDAFALAMMMTAAGIPATYFATRLGLRFFDRDRLSALRNALTASDRKTSLWMLGLFGALGPALFRYVVLNGVPLTDDEGSYQFAAELLASGRLWVESPRMLVFFDNGFMINDGKLYSQYFLGWPALLSLGVLLKAPGLVNPILSGITAVLIALIAERRFGQSWGRVAAMLYMASPFIAISAATQMSHTSSTFALALLLYVVDRCADAGTRKRDSALIAASFCLAFWIRPVTALGFGVPLLVSWLLSLRRRPASLQHIAIFAALSLVPALLFLWVNQQQTGEFLRTGYHAGFTHAAATNFRFTSFGAGAGDESSFLYFFVYFDPFTIFAKYMTVLMRLWTDSFGFPLGLSLVLLATRSGSRRLFWPTLGLLLVHIPLGDAGIDTFGPVHYTELMIPIVLCSVDGLRSLHALGARLELPALAPALLAASVGCAAVFYVVPRLTTIALLAADIRDPLDTFASAPEHSIVFAKRAFAPPCLGSPGMHWVLFRPNNDPDLKNTRLWANHIDLETNCKLLAATGRRGFMMRQDRKACRWELVPIERATAEEYPPAVKLITGDLGEAPRATRAKK